ncbi:hypothetical protein [Acinetobacter sp. BY484]|uniref:hypothetical protein n=1 Tax=Acinetobacter sp. BY484 TaxID=2820674 RepID=UPI001C248715|nr:hypothetical protein [Acinetobacter sp. BY484]
MSLEKLVNYHLKPSDTVSNRRFITYCAAFFIREVPAYIVTESGETFYDIPYDRITEIVFNQDCEIEKSELDDLKSTISERIGQYLSEKGISDDLLQKLENIPRAEKETIEENCSKHLVACYRKFVGHIGLAAIQKKFILEASGQADRIAKEAEKTAKQATEAAIQSLKNTENSTTQFVTILGIFASIIVALFGGMSLVKAAVELLTNEGNLALFVFVVSVLMLSLTGLIVLLTTWITSLNKEKSEKSYLCTKVILFGFLIICCFGSGLISYDLSKKPKPEKEMQISNSN